MELQKIDRLTTLTLGAFAATAVASIALQNLLLLAIALWGIAAWRHGLRPSLPRRPFTLVTLLFLATFLLSSALGVDPRGSFQSVHKYLLLLALFPIAAMRLKGSTARHPLYLYTAGAAVCALWGIAKHFFGQTDGIPAFFVREERIRSFSGHYMVFGGLLMLAVLLGFYFLLKNPRDRWSWAFLGLNLYGLMLTGTRGAWLGLAVGFVLWGFFTNKRWMLAGLAALLTVFLLVPNSGRDRIFDILQRNDRFERSSDVERLLIWKAGLRIVQDHMVFGIGHGSIGKVYPSYKETKATEQTVSHMHNNFMQIAVQNGLVGLGVFLAWLGVYVWTVRRERPLDPEDARLHFTLSCAFLASMVWGLTEYTFSHQFLSVQALLLGVQMGLTQKS
jgi:O-antigen ligase